MREMSNSVEKKGAVEKKTAALQKQARGASDLAGQRSRCLIEGCAKSRPACTGSLNLPPILSFDLISHWNTDYQGTITKVHHHGRPPPPPPPMVHHHHHTTLSGVVIAPMTSAALVYSAQFSVQHTLAFLLEITTPPPSRRTVLWDHNKTLR